MPPSPSPTTLLQAQLLVAKDAASKKQQKKNKVKQGKENKDIKARAQTRKGKTIHLS
jgi:hypothetical protein